MPSKPLWKTIIVVWSRYPGNNEELEDLAHDATSGDAYCSKYRSEQIAEPEKDVDWDGTQFFEEGWDG
jgi:hypothetical protein